MLKRFQQITGVGRFKDSRPAGREFGKETIVFAKNAKGKSTLTAILRSLRDNQPSLLAGRKTFGFTGDQKVEIDFDINGSTEKSTYANGKWTVLRPEIVIFDLKYVRDNVSDGFNVSHEHQANLRSVIIGDSGKEIIGQLSGLSAKQKESEAKKSSISEIFRTDITATYPGTTIDAFCKVGAEGNSEQTTTLQSKLTELKNASTITSLVTSTENAYKQLVDLIDVMSPLLGREIDANPDLVHQHITATWKSPEHPQRFLDEGLELTKPDMDSCVFCGQKLGQTEKELLAAYKQIFSQAYRDLQREVYDIESKFSRFDVRARISAFDAKLKENGLEEGIDTAELDRLETLKASIGKLIATKKRDLAQVVSVGDHQEVKDLLAILEPIVERLEAKNKELSETGLGEKITSASAKLSQANLTELRASTKWQKHCSEYMDAVKNLAQLKTDRQKLNRDLLSQQQSIFTQHEGTINEYLNALGAHFKIAGFKPEKDDRRSAAAHYCVFQIEFSDNHKVDLASHNDSSPSFDNSLSESDKRLLAFALFMSTIKNDANLYQKIVVFDDPMSSLDRERKRATASLIASLTDLSQSPEQLIILSHEDNFIHELTERPQLSEAVTLKVINTDDDPKYSDIDHLNLERDIPRDEVIATLDELALMLRNENIEAGFQNKCRSVLDGILMRKYRHHLKLLPERSGTRDYIEYLSTQKVNGFSADKDTSGRIVEWSKNQRTKDFMSLASELNKDSHTITTNHSSGDDKSLLTTFFSKLEEI